MPNEKGNDSYKKIKKYYDAIIIFDGIKFKIINNKIRIKNSVFNKIIISLLLLALQENLK